MKKKVKNILFKLDLNGRGIVNYDSTDQKFIYRGTNLKHMGSSFDNVNYSKKKLYGTLDNLSYKITISSNCLRHNIFVKDANIQSPNLIHNEMLLYSFIASPASLLRGYMFASEAETLKRTGALSIVDAQQTCNAISTIELFTKSGAKNTDKEKETSDNSLFYKETVGDISYSTHGSIDLMSLQFVSCDQIFDRYAFNPDMFETYKSFLSTKLPNFNSKLGYYQQKGSDIELSELGVKLSNENVVYLVKSLLNRLLSVDIRKSNSFASVSGLKYKLVYDPLVDTLPSEDDWVEVKSATDIENLSFEVEDFFIEEDTEKAKEKRQVIEENYNKIKGEKKAKKAEEQAKKKDLKDKKKTEVENG